MAKNKMLLIFLLIFLLLSGIGILLYFLTSGGKNCNQLIQENKCVATCDQGYFLNETKKACYKCDQSCLNCQNSSTFCTNCSSNYIFYNQTAGQCVFNQICNSNEFKYNFTCVQQCQNNTFGNITSRQCQSQCDNGYYGDKNTSLCQPCYQSCITCSDQANNCQSCQKGYYFLKNQCYQTCPNYYYNDNSTFTCSICVNKFPRSYGSKVLQFYVCPFQYDQACGQQTDISAVIQSKINVLHILMGISITDQNQANWYNDKQTQACYPNNPPYPSPLTNDNLKQLHDAGITILLSVGGWCYNFPLQQWNSSQVSSFVDQFERIRSQFNYYIDGIDFDWEAFCFNTPSQCGYNQQGKVNFFMPLPQTIQNLNMIALEMKSRGYVVTLSPMSFQLYSSNKNSNFPQNQYVKYGLNFSAFDGIYLQWFTQSGYDVCSGNSCGCNSIRPDISKICPSQCPRLVDCPDWQYVGESRYVSQINFLNNLSSILNVSQNLIIVLKFYQGSQEYGPIPSSDDVYNLDQAMKNSSFPSGLTGIGGYTLAGSQLYPVYGTQNSFATQMGEKWGSQLFRNTLPQQCIQINN